METITNIETGSLQDSVGDGIAFIPGGPVFRSDTGGVWGMVTAPLSTRPADGYSGAYSFLPEYREKYCGLILNMIINHKGR